MLLDGEVKEVEANVGHWCAECGGQGCRGAGVVFLALVTIVNHSLYVV